MYNQKSIRNTVGDVARLLYGNILRGANHNTNPQLQDDGDVAQADNSIDEITKTNDPLSKNDTDGETDEGHSSSDSTGSEHGSSESDSPSILQPSPTANSDILSYRSEGRDESVRDLLEEYASIISSIELTLSVHDKELNTSNQYSVEHVDNSASDEHPLGTQIPAHPRSCPTTTAIGLTLPAGDVEHSSEISASVCESVTSTLPTNKVLEKPKENDRRNELSRNKIDEFKINTLKGQIRRASVRITNTIEEVSRQANALRTNARGQLILRTNTVKTSINKFRQDNHIHLGMPSEMRSKIRKSKAWDIFSGIAQWKVLVACGLFLLVIFLTLARAFEGSDDDVLSPSNDTTPAIFAGSPLFDNFYGTNSETLADDDAFADLESQGMTIELRYLISLLSPIVSKVSEWGGDHLNDYTASKRFDETIVLKGSPQHNALAWLSHAIICRRIVDDDNNYGFEEQMWKSINEDDYECESLLSRTQLINRYALVTMYFAWSGKSWENVDGWLSYHSERNNPPSYLSSRKSGNDMTLNAQSNTNIESQRYPSDVCLWKGVTCRHEQLVNKDMLTGLDGRHEMKNNKASFDNTAPTLQQSFQKLGPFQKLGMCQGDCDSDEDCEKGLYCFFKDTGGVTSVPGCNGFDNSRTDYCTNKIETSKSTIAPTLSQEEIGIPLAVEGEEQIIGLDLSENNLVGYMSSVKEIRLISSLEDLDLSGNRLEGVVPDELGQLEELRSLNLSRNDLFGDLPVSVPNNLSRLEVLKLEDNSLVGGLKTFWYTPQCTDGLWKEFSADCSGKKPRIECPCCTKCCFATSGATKDRTKKGTDALICHKQRE